MKKLLVLMLVLCLVPMASAVLQISVNGVLNPVDSEITLHPSETLTLDIWTTTVMSAAGSTLWALTVQPVATIAGGSYVGPAGTYTDPEEGVIDNFKGVTFSNINGLVLPVGENGIQGTITIWKSGEILDGDGNPFVPPQYYPTIPLNTVLFGGIMFHCETQPGDAFVHLYTINNTTGAYTLRDTVIVHQIPEPATIMLLCLGGLLLRRKK